MLSTLQPLGYFFNAPFNWKKKIERLTFTHIAIVTGSRSFVDVAFNQKPQLPGCMRLLPFQPDLLNGLFYTTITQGYAEADLYCRYTGSVGILSTL